MHIPDGFFSVGTSLGAGATAAAGLTVVVKRAGRSLDDRRIPMAGLLSAFLFAAQMLNFPIAPGTSGHLLGGVLAGVLVGPWTGALAITVVLIVQTLFADGGVTALGLNVVNVSLVATLGGYAVFALLRRILPPTRGAVVAASGVAAGLSVLMASSAFVMEYAIGGSATASVSSVAWAMLGIHGLIALGEGLITASAIGLVLSTRPDLVFGAGHLPPISRSTATPIPERSPA